MDEEGTSELPPQPTSQANAGAGLFIPSPATPLTKSKNLISAVKDLKDVHADINDNWDDEGCFNTCGHSGAIQLRKLSEERAQERYKNILPDSGICAQLYNSILHIQSIYVNRN